MITCIREEKNTEINEQHKINTTLTVTTHITYETAVHRLAGVHSHELDHMQFSHPAFFFFIIIFFFYENFIAKAIG